tara:strand:- start:187 stop:441 length:255 start_codon:yes stop_codon:yes gene_type:complete
MINIFKRRTLSEGDLVGYRQGSSIIAEPDFLSRFFDVDDMLPSPFDIGLIVKISENIGNGMPLVLVLTKRDTPVWYTPLDLKLL